MARSAGFSGLEGPWALTRRQDLFFPGNGRGKPRPEAGKAGKFPARGGRPGGRGTLRTHFPRPRSCRSEISDSTSGTAARARAPSKSRFREKPFPLQIGGRDLVAQRPIGTSLPQAFESLACVRLTAVGEACQARKVVRSRTARVGGAMRSATWTSSRARRAWRTSMAGAFRLGPRSGSTASRRSRPRRRQQHAQSVRRPPASRRQSWRRSNL